LFVPSVHDSGVGYPKRTLTLHDVLRNIEQILVPFKRYIETFETDMAQAPCMAQAHHMAQAPLVA
jgi:hypothetical protein